MHTLIVLIPRAMESLMIDWAVAYKDLSGPPILDFRLFYLPVTFNFIMLFHMKAATHKSRTRVVMKYTVEQKH